MKIVADKFVLRPWCEEDAKRFIGLANTQLTRLFATPYGHNTASMRVLEKAGYTKVGLMRKAEMKNGEPIDKCYFELVK